MLPGKRGLSSLRNTTHHFARCELDSHADTCALGSNFIPLSFTGRACDVTPYNAETYEPERDIPIISGATAYTCQDSGQTYILVVNEGLWFGEKLQNTLLNPNQLRYAGVTVADNPFNKEEPISIVHNDVTIPLLLSGTTIFMETTTPTQSELDNCPHIQLTCDADWNPQTVRLSAAQSVEAESTIGVEPGLAQISSKKNLKSNLRAAAVSNEGDTRPTRSDATFERVTSNGTVLVCSGH
jgi:hypothetical protein